MLTTRFGIEIEFTGITRAKAAAVAAGFLNGSIERTYDSYDAYKIHLADGRYYKFMSDGSIKTQKKASGIMVPADREYSVELVSPILTYRGDIDTLQELARRLRKAGGFVDEGTCGIHYGKSNVILSLVAFLVV